MIRIVTIVCGGYFTFAAVVLLFTWLAERAEKRRQDREFDAELELLLREEQNKDLIRKLQRAAREHGMFDHPSNPTWRPE